MGRRFSVVVYKTYFNPRSYKRSDGSRDTTRKLFQNFNPRSYKRSDHDLLLQKLCQLKFQSTLLQEERRSRSEAWGHVPKFQSTLLQEERHNTDDACTDGLHISIHAPTRGATMIIWIKSAALHISIHAPTRGATGLKIPASHVYKFQSTLLQEERLKSSTLLH